MPNIKASVWWSKEELNLLNDLYINKKLSLNEIKEKLKNRTISSIKNAIFLKGLRRKYTYKISKAKLELIENIKNLHKKGFTNRKIARSLGVDHRTVGDYLRLLKIKPNGTIGQPINMVDDKNAKCSKCNEIRPLTEFIINRRDKKYEYRFSYCSSCRRIQLNNNLNKSIEAVLRNKWNRLRLKCRDNSIPLDFDDKYLVLLYKEQKGLCFYTKKEMFYKYGEGLNRMAISIDKIIPELGYIKGNTVLCTQKANTIKSDLTMEEIKSWLPPWYKKIVKYIELHKNNEVTEPLD